MERGASTRQGREKGKYDGCWRKLGGQGGRDRMGLGEEAAA